MPDTVNAQTQPLNDIQLRILLELRCIRLALVALACDGGKANPTDFDPEQLADDPAIMSERLL